MQLIKIFFHLRLHRDGAEEWGTSFFPFLPLYFFPFTQSNPVRMKKFQISSSEEVGVKDEPARRDREHNVLCRQFQRVLSRKSTCCVCQIDVSNRNICSMVDKVEV